MVNKALVYTIIVVGILILVGALIGVGVIFWTRERPVQKDKYSHENNFIEHYDRKAFESSEFQIYNYLLKPIKIESNPTTNNPRERFFSIEIDPQTKKSVPKEDIDKFFNAKREYRISILGLPDSPRWFSDFLIDPLDRVNSLHVGMITSKVVQTSNLVNTGWSAVQGVPVLTFHNETSMHLSINSNINVPPHSFINYSGRDQRGVRMGTILRDTEGIFPTFKIKVPATDIYWGVVSGIKQPLFGGWQLTTELNEFSNEPQYLLENGWMGGPSCEKIVPGILPIEGPPVAQLDRWGRSIKDYKEPEEKYESQSDLMKIVSGVNPDYQPAIPTDFNF